MMASVGQVKSKSAMIIKSDQGFTMNSSAKFRNRGILTGFITGVITTIVSNFATQLFTQPIILYSINHQGGNVELVMKNHGFRSADRVKLELELMSAVAPQPIIIDDYANTGQSSSKYFTLKRDNRIVRFDDLGELGGFSSGERFNVILKPLSTSVLSNYRNHDLSVVRHVGALSFRIDGVNSDFFIRSAFLSILIGFMLAIVVGLYFWQFLRLR